MKFSLALITPFLACNLLAAADSFSPEDIDKFNQNMPIDNAIMETEVSQSLNKDELQTALAHINTLQPELVAHISSLKDSDVFHYKEAIRGVSRYWRTHTAIPEKGADTQRQEVEFLNSFFLELQMQTLIASYQRAPSQQIKDALQKLIKQQITTSIRQSERNIQEIKQNIDTTVATQVNNLLSSQITDTTNYTEDTGGTSDGTEDMDHGLE